MDPHQLDVVHPHPTQKLGDVDPILCTFGVCARVSVSVHMRAVVVCLAVRCAAMGR